MNVCYSLILSLLLWGADYAIYLGCNHGLAPNARLQQLLRYLVASVVAVVPLAATVTDPRQPAVMLALATALLWSITYPLTFHLTNRRFAPDYDHQIDPAFGIYLFGWLTALLVLPHATWVAGVAMFVALMVCLFQWVYYATCHAAVDASGMKMLQETHYNEIIEFMRSYSIVRVTGVILAVVALATLAIGLPASRPVATEAGWWQTATVVAVWCFMTVYMFKPRHGLMVRTGLFMLYTTVREYVAQNSRYTSEQRQRLATLEATPLHPTATPHTLLMVIGESASRDYMSAFTNLGEDTTPWLRNLADDDAHCLLFPHAYSCDIQTVPTLEKALTEYNQYTGGQFYTSCSIVDMAHRLGYRVHWYSNQGHLGAADTPITLVANTSEVAKWTRQELGKPQYDETLIDFLDEVDPQARNLVVLHLKGSHFNYENRFTEETRQWGEPGSHDRVTNYKNSLYYTDGVLRQVFEHCRERLNLQAMVYFSDHADVPDRHRMPNFGGFCDTRIPLMVWLDDAYQATHPERTAALRQNRDRYWTNDLAYELMAGLFDARSNHFDETLSLASPDYRMTRDTLTAMNGRIKIADDQAG